MHLKVTTALIGLMVIFIALDAKFLENERHFASPDENTINHDSQTSDGQNSSDGSKANSPTPTGPNVNAVIKKHRYNPQPANREKSLLEQIIPADVANIQAVILMRDNDRFGLMAWTESDQVSIYFLALKEALHSTFSPQMKDLIDEQQSRPGQSDRSFLTFIDPAINAERIVFVKVQNRLFEFHIAENKDDEIYDLIENLTN